MYAGKKKNDIREPTVPSFSLYQDKKTGNHTKYSFKPDTAIKNRISIGTSLEYLAYAIIIIVYDGFITVILYSLCTIICMCVPEFQKKAEFILSIDVV